MTITNDNDVEEILRRYSNLKEPPRSKKYLLSRYNELGTTLFRDMPPSLSLPLRTPGIEKETMVPFQDSTKPHC